ncbi:substrate-binding domain-containing protein [Lachnospiraceae bacterium YH-ros2228]
MKRILLLTDGWRRFIVSAWSNGILQYMKEHDRDYSLIQFHCWGNWSRDKKFNEGEYSIFSLANFKDYDGIVVDFTNMEDEKVIRDLQKRIIESKVPAISLCNSIDGIPCVRNDNYHAICGLFEHMWNVHNCRTFHFSGSSQKVTESIEREQAFRDCCKRHGIEVTDDMITEMDYSTRTGALTAREFFDLSGKNLIQPLPDAFICANDNIAIGLIMEMRKHGYDCPRDFLVTGFDNLDKAMYYQPQITTVTLNRERIAYRAMQALDSMIQENKTIKDIHIPAEIVLAESCGCPTNQDVYFRSYLSWHVEDIIHTNDRNEVFALIARSLNPSLSLQDLMHQVMRRYSMLDLDGVYIVTDDRIGSEALPRGHYEMEHLRVMAACERRWVNNGSRMEEMQNQTFQNAVELKHHLDSISNRNSFILIPLHILDQTAGLIVLFNPRFISKEWYFYEFQDIVLHAISEWDTNRKLQLSLTRLRNVYDRDDLTGLYSKAAFESKLLPWVGQKIQEKELAVLFLDIDGFKSINDSRGHAFGDQVLKQVADAIREEASQDSFSYRYGGDEFVMILAIDQPEQAPETKARIINHLKGNHISVSIGLSYPDLTKWNPNLLQDGLRTQLDHCIQKADHDMYCYKRLHHTRR